MQSDHTDKGEGRRNIRGGGRKEEKVRGQIDGSTGGCSTIARRIKSPEEVFVSTKNDNSFITHRNSYNIISHLYIRTRLSLTESLCVCARDGDR